MSPRNQTQLQDRKRVFSQALSPAPVSSTSPQSLWAILDGQMKQQQVQREEWSVQLQQ